LNYTRICCYEVFNVIYISRYLGMCQVSFFSFP